MLNTIKIAASVPGSPWWEVAASLKKVLPKQYYELQIDWTTHGTHNLRAVANGTCDIGVTLPPFVAWAGRRQGPLSDIQARELRVLAAVNQPMWLVASADQATGFDTVEELVAARHPWKPLMYPKNSILDVYSDRLLELHGTSRAMLKSWGGDDPLPIKPPQTDGPVSKDALTSHRDYTRQLAAEGGANGLLIYVNLTSPWAHDLTSTRPQRYLTLNDSALDSVTDHDGGEKLTLPARLFPGLDRDLPTTGWRHQYIYGPADTNPDLVREILLSLEQPEFLDNAQGISYTAVEPKLIPGAQLHPASADWYATGPRPHLGAGSRR